MSDRVVETVLFRLTSGVSDGEFERAARTSSKYVEGCEGFIARRLSRAADGTWVEHIEWSDMDAARAAAAGIGESPDMKAFVTAIDGESVKMIHSNVVVAIN